jgi:hypothetical protein
MCERKTCFSAHAPGDEGTRDRRGERKKRNRKRKRIPPYLCGNV